MAKQQTKQQTKTEAPRSASTDLATLGGNSMAPVKVADGTLPDYIREDDQRGIEDLGMADLVIPRLEIVQGLSPAMKRGDPGFIPGAQQGMLNNSVTRELYGDTVQVVSVYFTVQWLVWRDRKLAELKKLPSEGGFFGAYPTKEEADARAEQEGGERGAIVVIDTPSHLCLLLNHRAGKPEEIMISMPRTKAKVSRQWNTVIKLAGKARFSRIYEVKTVLQKNPKGDFYNFALPTALVGATPEWLFKRAGDMYNRIKAGERRVVMDTKGMAGDEGGGEEDHGNDRM